MRDRGGSTTRIENSLFVFTVTQTAGPPAGFFDSSAFGNLFALSVIVSG